MNRKYALPTSIAMAVTASAGALVLAAGPAVAAVPACKDYDQNRSCVAVDYKTTEIRSIRVDGRCLWGASGYHPDVMVDQWIVPNVQTYGGAQCEGNTLKFAYVTWYDEDADGYRWVGITTDRPVGCGASARLSAARPNC